MLKKLVKYDLKWIYKVVIVFYVLAFIFSVFTRCFSLNENSILFNVISKICGGVAISMLVNSLINCLMRSWARFVKNVYKDESYLTHTLPVSKGLIYLSKVLSSILCCFTTVVVAIVCLFICYYSKENLDVLKGLLELAAGTYNTTVIKLLFSISFLVFLEISFVLLIGYVGIIIGHRFNRNKMIKTLVISFGLYLVTSLFSLVIIYIIGLFNSNVMNIINTSSAIDIEVIKFLMMVSIIIYFIYNLIYYFIGKFQLEKGVNVD